MSVPLIGITTARILTEEDRVLISMNEAYVQSVVRAGGIPVLIPTGLPPAAWGELFTHLSGVLITGGADVDPVLFNGEPHPRIYGIDAQRDQIEIGLVQQAVDAKMPLFGICRGIQVINVALGGTLYTDIADQKSGSLKHDWFPDWPRDYLSHDLTVIEDSQLKRILASASDASDAPVKVNSMHHQALRDLAPSLRPVAYAADGLVEAVELPGHPFGLGVQWHPECLPESPSQQALFRSFVSAAGCYSGATHSG